MAAAIVVVCQFHHLALKVQLMTLQMPAWGSVDE